MESASGWRPQLGAWECEGNICRAGGRRPDSPAVEQVKEDPRGHGVKASEGGVWLMSVDGSLIGDGPYVAFTVKFNASAGPRACDPPHLPVAPARTCTST
ncbi:hypothetical protein EYF80_022004 [Liparis tanakae]|uniref:Uncharacterized protein n=1 Tax=Liparis tanakae TaxID=230148 RepID=A0A4Z2HQE1_9TELE|nr:hypothetical protein EYF80_022004 [Liparis tanakae]